MPYTYDVINRTDGYTAGTHTSYAEACQQRDLWRTRINDGCSHEQQIVLRVYNSQGKLIKPMIWS